MGIFSKKKNDDFYNLIQQKAAEKSDFELPQPKREEHLNPEHVLTSEEILSAEEKMTTPKPSVQSGNTNNANPLDAMRKRMLKNVGIEENEVKKAEEPKKEDTHSSSLLDRCLPYIIDENGKNSAISEEPIYKLESVADILRGESKRSIEALSKEYDISMEYLESHKVESQPKEETVTRKAQEEPQKPIVEEISQIGKEEKDDKNSRIFEEIVAGLNAVAEKEEEPLPDLSDIDNEVKKERLQGVSQNTATVTFTPIKNTDDTQRISVSSFTRPVDLSDEFGDEEEVFSENMSEAQVEQSDFEDFEPTREYKSANEAKKFLRILSINKRRAFLQLSATVILTAVLLLLAIPQVSSVFTVATGMTVCSVIIGLIMLINWDMFISLKVFLSRRSSPDCMAVLAALSSLTLSVVASVLGEEQYQMVAIGAVVLLWRSISVFMSATAKCGNFRQIITSKPKKAVTLLSDTATTFSMAKNAVEGDALVAAPRSTELISDFMKYSDYSTVLGSKMRVISVASLVISVIVGFVSAAYFDAAIYGFFATSATICFAAAPTLFLIDVLPCYQAARRLNKRGSMIAGITAAKHIETANTTVLKSCEIFPEGTVTMHEMSVLSENNLDDIFMRAASLTQVIESPLASIFKRIAGSNKAYTIPDSDTVKYEERMGISGWVDDELMFIGNRTLMLAHGIAVPDIEIDRKILRKGCFPVYIATGGKACALLSVKYDVDEQVARELHKLTGMGVTLLVDNCDPNLTDEMIYDYIGLYPDSVKIMSAAGVHMYRNAIVPAKSCSAPACFRENPISLISVINCASRMKKANLILTVMYVLAAVLGVVVFAYVSFAGSDVPPSAASVMFSHFGVAALSYLMILFTKP